MTLHQIKAPFSKRIFTSVCIFVLSIFFGLGSLSAFASSDTTPPSAPSQLIAVAVSSSQVSLSWMPSTDDVGVTGYNIYENGSEVATSATTSYSVTSLNALTSYSFTVAAYDAAGNISARSASASATTQSLLPPSAPVLTVSPLSPTQVSLSWTASTSSIGIAGYDIYQNGLQIGTTANTYYTVSGLALSTTYNFSVAGYDTAGNTSPQSEVIIITTQDGGTQTAIPPSVPTVLTASSVSSSQINLTWTSSTDTVAVTGYDIYENGSQIDTTTNTYYSATGLTPATSYSFTVAAYDAAGNTSAQSASASAMTSLAPITPTTPVVATPTISIPVVVTTPVVEEQIPGCTGTDGFSVTTGQSCAGNLVTTQPAMFTFTKYLKKGSSGNEVIELQTFLNAAGYDCGTPDGRFGSKTKAALVDFQIAHQLEGDGITGPLTRAALNQ